MKANQNTLNDFFSKTSTNFIIPVYQRNYAWEKEHCKKLLEDILSICKNSKKHFMGTITYILHHRRDEHTLREIQEYVIIDGQQRITTLMLFLKALGSKIQDNSIRSEIRRFLHADSISDNTKLRLKPIKKDRDAYNIIMEINGDDWGGRWQEADSKSHIRLNYQYFLHELNEIQKEGKYSFSEIYGAFLRLIIVEVALESGDDDAQVVFESINSTGKLLEKVDLIRNYLMMDKHSNEQERLYRNWSEIENLLSNEKNLEIFIEHYLRIYFGAGLKKDSVYFSFKKHARENPHLKNNTDLLIEDMTKYAKIYKLLIDTEQTHISGNASDREKERLRGKIRILVDLKFGVAYPFVMQIIDDFYNNKLDINNLGKMIDLLINYNVRREICKLPTAALNKVTYKLYDTMLNSGSEKIDARNLAYVLGQKDGVEVFPNDEYIKREFIHINAYSLTKCAKLILYSIEKLTNKEAPSNMNELEIEHFCPQKPNKEWLEMLGDDAREIENYIHTFGNLSLSAINQTLSNKSFRDKLELLDEYGALHLNEYFLKMGQWKIEDIKNRSSYLVEQFIRCDMFKDLELESRKRVHYVYSDDR